MTNEAQILQDLFSKWVSIGLEYAGAAPDVRALYIYASCEGGAIFANVYYDQGGTVIFPDDLKGGEASTARVRAMQRFLREDLSAANKEFDGAGIPRPTEYKVYYEPSTRKLDVQLSRELIYENHPTKIPERGIEDWLGDRAPKLF
ncbi:hypothetical protein [Microbacterium sp. SORGH_AS_0888]|uniref:hypothetical protein n=1 Tax=Microbacterium sp. SORGH_AS_0888 TaxID=3041791 RepID=UPI002783472D|nr:hypothetical protein [Microbacterium sp. SORGH_AS_0888]MDQ1131038.1 hypothetical protein [Microbacterium sp. SORGH_AS_0888]